jgi:LuxR family transcriptional regulator, maltose regulon positive regulatory protein
VSYGRHSDREVALMPFLACIYAPVWEILTIGEGVRVPDPLLATKVSLPLLRHPFVPRREVLNRLSAGLGENHLLTLISAPAGYGKTTTIRMWVEEAGYPVAWVTLEKSDNDLKQFLAYILTALQRAGDDLGQAALEVVENTQEIDLQRILGYLINDLYNLDKPIILVLEEYQLIENEKIDQIIEWMLNQAIANLHLVIATREDPNLPLTRLRVRNQLTEIRAIDLSFSLEEADQFFSNVMGVNISKREMEILQNRTEGWVASLQLAALSLKESRNPTKFVEAFRGTHRHVLDYLIQEVLSSQPDEIREFLYRTSILDQLSPSLCEAVTGQKASRKYLNYLENNNLFLIPLDEERTWYRYHALFGELLRNQLLQAEPECVDDLHERTADWYQKNGFIEKAVEHAYLLSSSNKVFELIEKYALPMLYQGEVSTVVGWFDRLPESLMQSSPMTCISKAWALAVMQHQTHTEEVEQALQAADNALNRANADEALRNLITGHAASIHAFLMQSPAFGGEKPEKLIEASQKAQNLLPQDEKAIRSVNALNIGYGYTALADLPAAERAYQQALEDGVAGGNWYAAIYGPIDLIAITIIKGELKAALQLCEENIDRFNQLLAGQRFPPIGDLYSLKGSVLLEENHLAEAEQALIQGVSLLRWTGEYEAHIRGYSALARLRSIQGDWAGMLESLKSLEESRQEVATYAQALRHRWLVHDWAVNKNNLEEARLWVAQAAIRFNDLPNITGVDPVSRMYFQTYLNMAHILTRLAVPNPQAYSLLDAHNYLARQEQFAAAHELVGWLVEIWIVRALMYQVEGKTKDAHRMIQAALSTAAHRGYFRIFLDERDLMRPLLEFVEPRLKDNDLSAFVERLLEAMLGESVKAKTSPVDEEKLSVRELEVLGLLAAGQTYKEIGQQLFLSLNTVQFHVKNIYSKLLVNKRTKAIEKAREMKLI